MVVFVRLVFLLRPPPADNEVGDGGIDDEAGDGAVGIVGCCTGAGVAGKVSNGDAVSCCTGIAEGAKGGAEGAKAAVVTEGIGEVVDGEGIGVFPRFHHD